MPAVMRMNVEQAAKANDAETRPASRQGRLPFPGEVTDLGTQEFCRGNADGMDIRRKTGATKQRSSRQ